MRHLLPRMSRTRKIAIGLSALLTIALAALFFLIPRTFRLGAVGLLVAIGIAFAAHAALGEFRGDLMIYALVVVFALVHGPLSGGQWRAALSRRPYSERCT